MWSMWPECAIGIACGYTVGVDIDVLDGELSLRIDALAREMLGDTPLVRIGLPPKRLLVYRAEVPFPKRSRKPVEILGRGSQFVARSIHPDTGQPYTWPEEQPEDVDVSRLPLVTQEQCLAFLDAAYDLVPPELRPQTIIGNAPTGAVTAGDPRGTRAAIESALRYLPNNDMDRDSWVKIGHAIKGALGEEGRDIWLNWSRQSSKSGKSGTPDTPERKWHGFRPSSIGAGTIYYLASREGWMPPADIILNAGVAEAVEAMKGERHPAQGILDQIKALRATSKSTDVPAPRTDKITLNLLAGRPIPERQWIVPHWVPVGQVTLLYADGGVGKSMLALQLMIASAKARAWCGLPTAQCSSVGLFSEDEMDEVHRRASAIAAHEGIPLADLWEATVMSGVGRDNTLVNVSRDGVVTITERWHEFRDEVLSTGSRLAVIDTAATSLNGSENDRTTVTKFVGAVLANLAQEIGGAVLLLAHPSRSGKGDAKGGGGEMDSGSTAWNASARSRISLEVPWDKDTKQPLINRREMVLRKANYAKSGQRCQLGMTDTGVFMPMVSIGGVKAAGGVDMEIAAAKPAVMNALQLLANRGFRVSDSKRSEYHIYDQMLKLGLAGSVNRVIADRALAELMRDGLAEMVPTGPPSKPAPTIRPANLRHDGSAMH